MEQVMSERARWVSRSLAAVVFLIAVRIAYGLIKYLFTADFTLSAGVIFFVVLFLIIGVGVCSFFLWLAVQFWTQFETAHVQLLAVIPALLVYGTIGLWLNEWGESSICHYWPDSAAMGIVIGFSNFFGLLAAGLVYLGSKRLLFRLLDQTELINPVAFQGNRKHYLKWLAFFFWGAMLSIFRLFEETGHIDIHQDWWFPFMTLLVPVLIAVIFYKLCVKIFVTRPLKRLQPE